MEEEVLGSIRDLDIFYCFVVFICFVGFGKGSIVSVRFMKICFLVVSFVVFKFVWYCFLFY